MSDLKKAYDELVEYIKPYCFPIAIKMVRGGEPLPEKVKRPLKDFGKRFSTCQAYNLVRRYGWILALSKEDMQCTIGITVLGFDKPLPYYLQGNLCEGMYTETKEAGARTEAVTDRFEPGRYHTILMAPLHRCEFQPDVICLYGNPAQIMRLIQGALWKRGGRITSGFSGRVDCSDIIVTPQKTQDYNVVLPCTGDRIFAQTQDHEMAFSFPAHLLEELLEGLRGTHRGGLRYPITSFLDYQASFPPKYMDLFPMWEKEKGHEQVSGGGEAPGPTT